MFLGFDLYCVDWGVKLYSNQSWIYISYEWPLITLINVCWSSRQQH